MGDISYVSEKVFYSDDGGSMYIRNVTNIASYPHGVTTQEN
jgi:hypothetical protein